MSNITIGAQGVVEGPIRYRFGPQQGFQTIRNFTGPQAGILSVMTQFTTAGWEVEVLEGPKWSLTATAPLAADGSVEAPIDNWDVFTNRIQSDIRLYPTFTGLTDKDIKDINTALAATSPPATPFTGTKQLLYSHLLIKANDYVINQQVVRHTQVASNSYAISTAYANVGRIHSTTKIGAPSNFVGLAASGDSPKTALTDGSASYKWVFGWLKNPPQIQQSAFNKISIIQDFEFGEWNTYIYGTLIT